MKLGFFDRLSIALNAGKLQKLMEKYASDFLSGKDLNTYIYDKETIDLSYSAFFACLRVLAESFASVPVFEYKTLPNGDREQSDKTGVYSILHDLPNGYMSSYNWHEAMMYQLNLGGNAICVREEDTGGLNGLIPIEHDKITIRINRESGDLEYVIKGKESEVYKRDEVFHVPGPSTNGIIGMSILEYARNAIHLGLSYEKFGNRFFKNGALSSGFFEHPSTLDDTAFVRLKETIAKEYAGLENAGRPMLLEDGMKFNPLTMKLSDAEFLASKKFQVEEMCRYCRVPLHMVQNLDKASFNNIEHLSLEFVMYTMLPHFKRFEQCINTQLLTSSQRKKGFYYEYKLDSLIRADVEARYKAYGIARQWGWFSVNDILRLENRPRIPNGDIYLQPVNMVEAGTPPQTEAPISDDVKREIDSILR